MILELLAANFQYSLQLYYFHLDFFTADRLGAHFGNLVVFPFYFTFLVFI